MRNRIRRPAHPGRILKNLYLGPLNITNTDFAKRIGVSRKTISAIVNERKSVTPEMALRFSKAFSNSSPESWLNLQKSFDLWKAARESSDWKQIEPFPLSENDNLDYAKGA